MFPVARALKALHSKVTCAQVCKGTAEVCVLHLPGCVPRGHDQGGPRGGEGDARAADPRPLWPPCGQGVAACVQRGPVAPPAAAARLPGQCGQLLRPGAPPGPPLARGGHRLHGPRPLLAPAPGGPLRVEPLLAGRGAHCRPPGLGLLLHCGPQHGGPLRLQLWRPLPRQGAQAGDAGLLRAHVPPPELGRASAEARTGGKRTPRAQGPEQAALVHGGGGDGHLRFVLLQRRAPGLPARECADPAAARLEAQRGGGPLRPQQRRPAPLHPVAARRQHGRAGVLHSLHGRPARAAGPLRPARHDGQAEDARGRLPTALPQLPAPGAGGQPPHAHEPAGHGGWLHTSLPGSAMMCALRLASRVSDGSATCVM